MIHSSVYATFKLVFFFQAEDGIRDGRVTGVQTCALPISSPGIRAGTTSGARVRSRRRTRAGRADGRTTTPAALNETRLMRLEGGEDVPMTKARKCRNPAKCKAELVSLFGPWSPAASALVGNLATERAIP